MVWLGLGANLGDRTANLRRAVGELKKIMSQVVQSPLYRTSPQDNTAQGDFINMAVKGCTSLSPAELLEHILEIELRGGRAREFVPEKGPRTIDIDILLWDSCVIDIVSSRGNTLTIPHPAMCRRLFVLKPLLDLDPDIPDPIDGIPYREKASYLKNQSVRLYRT